MDIASAISAAAAISSQKDRTVRYRELVDDAVDGGECAALLALLDHLLQEEVPQVISRQVVRHFADALARLKPAAKFEEVATGAIGKLAAQVVSFEESDYALRQTLFAHLLEAEEYKAAAGYLAGINVETSARAFSDVEKAELYVKIAETYLEVGSAALIAIIGRANGGAGGATRGDLRLELSRSRRSEDQTALRAAARLRCPSRARAPLVLTADRRRRASERARRRSPSLASHLHPTPARASSLVCVARRCDALARTTRRSTPRRL